MNTKEKGKFNEALKLFDNKEYKNAKKACDKILDKQPTHADAMALKGLVMTHMNEKTEGTKVINDAIKLNMKNANAWHFFALFHKEDKNYAQAMRCYMQAQKHDPENFNVVRDLSYLQLYLRQFSSFLESARKGMEMRANMMVNWSTYAFANYLNGYYESAFKVLESCKKIGAATIKDQERHEILLFQAAMLIKQQKYEEALDFMLENEKLMAFDKVLFTEKLIFLASKLGKKESALEYINKALKLNSENADYYINYINVVKGLSISNFEELLKYSVHNPETAEEILKVVQEDLKPRIHSRLINRIELALSTGDKFKEIFRLYFLQNVKQDLPSFFINVKFLYTFQPSKIKIIEEILSIHLESIKNKNKLDETLSNGEILDSPHHLIWVYYYAAQHYDNFRDLEKALNYINMAIDSTPSVVEFYMIKSKILKHGGMLKEAAQAYDKAKKLDLGDRYLNARYAKIYTRMGDVNQSVEIMKEFVRDPLNDENAEHFQCMWYEAECGYAYLLNKNILRAHRLFKFIFIHFSTLIEDQFDFYNYCLRRFMINDFARTIEYMDKLLDQKYVYKALEAFNIVLQYLKQNQNPETEKKLMNEYEEMQKEKLEKYKFKDSATLIKEMENDIYNFCVKLQSYSKNVNLHHLSVIHFLNKGKVMLALKSLLFLQQHSKGSFEYLESLNNFHNYLSNNKDKINPSFIEIIHSKLDLFKNEETLTKFLKEERVKVMSDFGKRIESLLTDAYECIFNRNQSIEKIFETLTDDNQNVLRNIKSHDMIKMKIYLSLFSGEGYLEKICSSLCDKIKIQCQEKDISDNLGFYEEFKN